VISRNRQYIIDTCMQMYRNGLGFSWEIEANKFVGCISSCGESTVMEYNRQRVKESIDIPGEK